MFTHIMAPVDLGHLDTLKRALTVVAAQARTFGCPVTYVSVTGTAPSPLARTPQEFTEKLEAFAAAQAEAEGIACQAHVITVPDPAVDLDSALLAAVNTLGADLVVMASHPPGKIDTFWHAHGGRLASHSGASVMLVRDI